MKWNPLSYVTAILAVCLLPCRAEERELRTVAEIRALRDITFNAEHPLSLTGVVTWVLGTDKVAAEANMPGLSAGGGWSYRTFRAEGSVADDAAGFLRAVIE